MKESDFPFTYQGMVSVHLPAMCSWTFKTYVTYHALTYHEPPADCEYILNLFLLFPENVKEIRFPSGLHNFNLFEERSVWTRVLERIHCLFSMRAVTQCVSASLCKETIFGIYCTTDKNASLFPRFQ